MSPVEKLRDFVSQRLHAAVEEILLFFEKTVLKYEEEAALKLEVISRQHALLCALHKPLMELPAADAFTQQLLVNNEGVPPELQDQQRDHLQDQNQDQDLDVADIIQFTYSSRSAARPNEDAQIKPGPGVDQEVHLLSSETEDSDDYSRDWTDSRSASTHLKPGGAIKGRHTKARLQGAEPGCSLKLHPQTHRSTERRKRKLENQTRFRTGTGTSNSTKTGICTRTRTGISTRNRISPSANTGIKTWTRTRTSTSPGTSNREEEGGTMSLQQWKKKKLLKFSRQKKKKFE